MEMEQRIFIPMKVVEKEWLDSLLSGNLFMRSLFHFGAWNISKRSTGEAEDVNNDFRGDVYEGLVRNVDPKVGDDYFNSFSPQIRKALLGASYIFDGAQFIKIFSMYCFTHNLDTGKFEIPDKRICQFGEYAVVITDPNEFVGRIVRALNERFGDNVNFEIREVRYFDYKHDFGDYDHFSKRKEYAWQEEIRIAAIPLDPDQAMQDESGRTLKAVVQDIEPLILGIGDIRDITKVHRTEDITEPSYLETLPRPVIIQGDNQ